MPGYPATPALLRCGVRRLRRDECRAAGRNAAATGYDELQRAIAGYAAILPYSGAKMPASVAIPPPEPASGALDRRNRVG